MPFFAQGKTNWKFLLIVFVLAIIVGGGIWLLTIKKEIPPAESSEEGITCSKLNEEQCRIQSSCVPLGEGIVAYFAEGETESFSFKGCVNRMPEYAACKEVVKMTQMRGGSQYSKECRCCCGEGPFCKEKPYPEK